MLEGLMQDRPLLISSLIEHANTFHPHAEIVSRTVEGPIHRCTYARHPPPLEAGGEGAASRSASSPATAIATLAWNGYRHMELYFGVSGMGAVLHTINPRLFPEQIEYIANHAEDKYLFFDLTFVPLLEKLAPALKTREGLRRDDRPRAHAGGEDPEPAVLRGARRRAGRRLRVADVRRAHRVVALLHVGHDRPSEGRAVLAPVDGAAFVRRVRGRRAAAVRRAETALLVVPMFHVNAWGTPYAGAMSGAKLVMPGPALDGKSVYELMQRREGDAGARACRPSGSTLFNHVDAAQPRPEEGSGAEARGHRRLGGAARDERAVRDAVRHVRRPRVGHDRDVAARHDLQSAARSIAGATLAQRLDVQGKQGRPIYGVELRITDDEGRPLPHDGKAYGHLMVRGPWITKGYFTGEGGDVLDADGFFDTGDVATIDPDGYMQITDRAKDVIKSGGEWISSIDLENAAMGHPAVAEAAVIGVAHPKWQERPLLVVVKKQGKDVVARRAARLPRRQGRQVVRAGRCRCSSTSCRTRRPASCRR